MQYLKYAITAIIITLFFGCVVIVEQPSKVDSAIAVSSVWDIPTQLPQGSSFQLAPNYLEQVSTKHRQVKDTYHALASAISDNLLTQGYQLAQENGDFTVSFGMALSDELDDKMISKHFGLTPGLQTQTGSLKGSLLISVEKSHSKQRIWRGTAQGFVLAGNSNEDRIKRINKVVNMVLAAAG